MSYVRRQPTIEAILVDDAIANSANEPAWLEAQLVAGIVALASDHVELQTKIGVLRVPRGQYLLFDADTGALSCMTADRFEKLYEVKP